MSEAADMREREAAMLARLAELDLLAAEKAHAAMMAAEDPKAVAELSRAYQRMARSLRQTLLTKARLAEAGDTRDRKAAEATKKARKAETDQRRARIRYEIERLLEPRLEQEDLDEAVDTAERRLKALAEDDETVLDLPIPTLVRQLLIALHVEGYPIPPDLLSPTIPDTS